MEQSEGVLGEVPKLVEGTPLERVQVVNSGARVRIPPSPLCLVDASKHRLDFESLGIHMNLDKQTVMQLRKFLIRISSKNKLF